MAINATLLEDKPQEQVPQPMSCKKRILFNMIAFAMVSVMYSLYYISLGICPYSYDDPNVCIEYFRVTLGVWIIECVIAGSMWAITFVLSVNRVFSRLWIPVLLISF